MKCHSFWGGMVASVLVLGGSAWGGQFRDSNFYAAGYQSIVVGAADFNHDGHLDLAVGDYAQTDNVRIFLGRGDGNFNDALSFTAPAYMAPESFAPADLNGDGIMDLVIGGDGIAVASYLGNGDGTFRLAAKYRVSVPLSVAVADLNGDGVPDLAVASLGTASAQVFIGNGDGTFQAPVFYGLDYGTEGLVINDFNSDGHPDLAVVVFCSRYHPDCMVGEAAILMNNGDGTFQSPLTFEVGPGPIGIASADLNHDGTQDLVVTNGNFAGRSTVSVLRGRGDGTFAKAEDERVGAGPMAVVVADFDGDQNFDLAVANADSNDVTVLRGHRTRGFHKAADYPMMGQAVSLVAGDFNEDGAPDLAIVDLDGFLQLLINTGLR